jgi:predicted nucleic acid-binding protein
MLEEYDEILSRLYSSAQSNKVINELVTAPNVEKVTVYYNWYLIADPDDNKFVDCAVAANAHAIVTHDRHFRKLKYTEFPELQVFNLQQFKSILQGREGGEDIFEW